MRLTNIRIQIYPTAIVSITVRLYVSQSVSEGRGDILNVTVLTEDGSTINLVQNRKEVSSSDGAVTVSGQECLQHIWNMKCFTNKWKCKNQDTLSSSRCHGSHAEISIPQKNTRYKFSC
jgi:hypothetical protein